MPEIAITDHELVYRRHVQTVYRVCYAYMRNSAEAEDAVSETFCRMIKSAPDFEGEEHEKAWLIRVAVNVCKNMLKHWWNKREPLDAHGELTTSAADDDSDVMEHIKRLPDKYKAPVYLYYCEGYKGDEIASILGVPSSTVRNWLREARFLLKNILEESYE